MDPGFTTPRLTTTAVFLASPSQALFPIPLNYRFSDNSPLCGIAAVCLRRCIATASWCSTHINGYRQAGLHRSTATVQRRASALNSFEAGPDCSQRRLYLPVDAVCLLRVRLFWVLVLAENQRQSLFMVPSILILESRVPPSSPPPRVYREVGSGPQRLYRRARAVRR